MAPPLVLDLPTYLFGNVDVVRFIDSARQEKPAENQRQNQKKYRNAEIQFVVAALHIPIKRTGRDQSRNQC
jgi:hypothetical protein